MFATWKAVVALSGSGLGMLVPLASGQRVLHEFSGDSAGDAFGYSVSTAGDVNGDGFADLIVGAIMDDNNGKDSGSARVFSGADGSILYTWDGGSAKDRFGHSVSGAGDVDGDGYADLIVGTPWTAYNGEDSGRVQIFSGKSGSLLYTFDGSQATVYFGWSVSGAGDVNADGFDDVIVGALLGVDVNGSPTGSAQVFSGKDGSVIHTLEGANEYDFFGVSVSGLGDIDADGFDDVIVGAPLAGMTGTDRGTAQVFSGRDGLVKWILIGDSDSGLFGISVGAAGDVNGDGAPDAIVGAYRDSTNGKYSGMARVFGGPFGSVLYTFHGDSPDDLFGSSVSGAGDVDGDGFGDLIVGALDSDPRVFSGKDGSILYDVDTGTYGATVAGAGDVDGNGCAEVIVGAPGAADTHGLAQVVSGCCPLGTSYCGPANLNSTGQSAAVQSCGLDAVAENYLVVRATDMPIDELGYFVTSETQGFTPFPGGSQGNLCLGGTIGRFRKQIQNSGASGSFSIDVDLTDIPPLGSAVQPGETWNFQAWFRDKNPTPTSNFTDGVSITFL